MKYYAVRHGKKPGIYTTWADAKKQIDGYPKAMYKSFPTKKEAEDFVSGKIGYSKVTSKTKTSKLGTTASTKNNLKDYDIVVYTDGGSRNTGNVAGGHVRNSDKAAWAYLIQMGEHKAADSAGERGATNNKMEITALLSALKKLIEHNLQGQKIIFVLDSRYVLDAINKHWLDGWAKRGWTRTAGELVNKELWQEIYKLLPQFKNATFDWTKGHAANAGNIYVDELLNKTMDKM